MTFSIKRFKKDATEPYVPLFGGFRARAKNEPGFKPPTFHLRSMSFGDLEKYDLSQRTSINFVTGQVKTDALELQKEIFLAFCMRIENVDVDEEPVVRASQLIEFLDNESPESCIDADLKGLIDEVVNAVQSRSVLERGLSKNWETSFDFGLTNEEKALPVAGKNEPKEDDPVSTTEPNAEGETAKTDMENPT